MDDDLRERLAVKDQIIEQLKTCCRNLGARSDLLAIISRCTGHPDRELLDELRAWNSHGEAD